MRASWATARRSSSAARPSRATSRSSGRRDAASAPPGRPPLPCRAARLDVRGLGARARPRHLGEIVDGLERVRGLVFFTFAAPALLAALGGYVADRVRKRPLMIATHVTIGLLVLSLLAVH